MLEAAETSNRIASGYYRNMKENGAESLGVSYKPNEFERVGWQNVFTKADTDCEKAIIARLKQCCDIPILAEESTADMDDSAMADGTRRWVIDPIDGTFCLKHGIPDFSSTIALQEKQAGQWKTLVGAVSLPMQNEIYLADKNSAHLIQGNREKTLQVRLGETKPFGTTMKEATLGKRIESVIFKSDGKKLDEHWMQTRERVFERLGDAKIETLSSAMVIAKIADNWFDGAILAADALKLPWDTAAAIHIAEKAGAKIKQFELDGEPVVVLANSDALLRALEMIVTQEHQRDRGAARGVG